MRRLDPYLFPEFHGSSQRWLIRRRNPIKRHVRADIVRVWCIPDGSRFGKFLPLDGRVLQFLHKADIQRRFQKIDRKRWANLVQREIDAMDARREADVRARWDDQKRARADGLRYVIKKGDRGVAVKPEDMHI